MQIRSGRICAGIQMPWMAKLDFSVFLVVRKHVWACCSHPCVLDPGNPCRDDGVSQALVYHDQRSAWEPGNIMDGGVKLPGNHQSKNNKNNS
jgi:hypothetical protein